MQALCFFAGANSIFVGDTLLDGRQSRRRQGQRAVPPAGHRAARIRPKSNRRLIRRYAAIRTDYAVGAIMRLVSDGVDAQPVFLDRPAAAAFINENLITTAPAGYHIGFQNKGDDGLITEWVPAGETVENWTEMVTVQVFYHLKTSPEAFMSNLETRWLRNCPGASGATDRQCPRERLSDPGVAVKLPAKSRGRQDRDHLVQGGAGQRQFLCRAEGVQVCAIKTADHALGRLSESRARVQLAASGPRLPAEQELACARPKSPPPAATVYVNRVRGHEPAGIGAKEQHQFADFLRLAEALHRHVFEETLD